MDIRLISRLTKLETYFSGTQYEPYVRRARQFVNEGRMDLAEEVMKTIPDEKELLDHLIEKLKGKPIYKTLRLIHTRQYLQEDKTGTVPATVVKGLFSLGTHILIECEKGNREYRMLLPLIFTRIGSMMHRL